MEGNLSLILHPKRAVRMDALSSMVAALITRPVNAREFAAENFATIVYHCLRHVNNGTQKRSKVSTEELRLSVKALALLAMNLDAKGCNAHQVFDECLPVLSQALTYFKSSDPETMIVILECLAIVGFFGCTHAEETQTVMLVVWDSLVAHSDDWSSLVRAGAILAWSFLLSSMPGSHVSHKSWKSVVSYFFNLLTKIDNGDDNDACTVILAVADALALICHSGFLNKFSSQEEDHCRAKIKDKITEKLLGFANEETGEEHSNKGKIKQAHRDVLELFRDQDDAGKTIKIGQKVDGLELSNVSEIIKMKFMTRFLGAEGFAKHLRENRNLHDMFEFRLIRSKEDPDELLMPEREEVIVRFYQHGIQRQKDDPLDMLPFMSGKQKQAQKRMIKSPYSSLNKARSQLLNKQRQAKAGTGYD